jgi:hypothetical protein
MKICVAILLLFALVSGPAAAEPFRLQVRLLQAHPATSLDPSALDREIRSGRLAVLDEGELLAQVGDELESSTGARFPYTFPDPRTGGSQVQYHDIGFRILAASSPAGAGRLRVDLAIEQLALSGDKGTLPPQDGVKTKTALILHPGQTLVVLRTHGRLTGPALKAAYPGKSFGEKDELIVVVTLRR